MRLGPCSSRRVCAESVQSSFGYCRPEISGCAPPYWPLHKVWTARRKPSNSHKNYAYQRTGRTPSAIIASTCILKRGMIPTRGRSTDLRPRTRVRLSRSEAMLKHAKNQNLISLVMMWLALRTRNHRWPRAHMARGKPISPNERAYSHHPHTLLIVGNNIQEAMEITIKRIFKHMETNKRVRAKCFIALEPPVSKSRAHNDQYQKTAASRNRT